MDLAELSDRQEITDVITAYTRAVDTSQWDKLYDVFTEDAVLDYRPTGGPSGPLSEAIPFIRNLEGFTVWQHLIGQIEITFDDAERSSAKAVAYFFNPMVAPAPDGGTNTIECGGYYRHELVRTENGWRSRHMVDDLIWSR